MGVEFQLIGTLPFLEKDPNFTYSIHTHKNESYARNTSMMRLHMYGDMAFLVTRNTNKHSPLTLGIDHMTRNNVEIQCM